MNKIIFLLFSIITHVESFIPGIALNGPINDQLRLFSVPRTTAFKCVKKYQLEEVYKNSPRGICSELDEARELLRSPIRTNDHVSFLMTNDNEHLFTIIYRMNNRFPKVYTVEAIIRTPESDKTKCTIHTLEVERMLMQMCEDRMGFLQFQNIKLWAGGKYKMEMYLEKQMLN